MYTNINGTPTSGTLSTGDLAALKAEITSLQALDPNPINGFSNAAVATYLNSPTLTPNPQPQGTVPQSSLPKTTVLSSLLSLQLQATAASNAAAVAALSIVENSVQGNPLDPIPAADIQGIAALVSGSFSPITAAVTAALNPPDPAWPAKIQLSPWALVNLSVPTYLQDTDIAAALAS